MKVFISYSRKDSEFAHWLWQILKTHRIDATLDHQDILPGEEWKKRLAGLIQSADAVVFCVSPNFANSDICNWELTEADRLGKRLLPVICSEAPTSSVPYQLSRLNYIFIRSAVERSSGIHALTKAINTDIDWVRDHTRYGELANRWISGNRSRDLLIRGRPLQAMQQWIQKGSESKPLLTSEIKLFLVESKKEEARRASLRRRMILLVSVLAILSSVTGLGWWLQDLVKEQAHWRMVMKPTLMSDAREADLRSHPGHVFADCEIGCPKLVVIAPGTFEMGSVETRFSREVPTRKVHIHRAFAIAQTELTFEEWDHCVTSGACRGDVSTSGWERGKQPVINVTWKDAQQYVAWLSKVTGRVYRLPTEAEWEYAARAGSQQYFSFGNNAADLDAHGWFADNSDHRPQPVAQKRPNNFGLYDMHGNVAEWTEDCANDNYQNAPVDGSAWLKGNCMTRVFRGGSWLHGARMARSANRDWLIGDDRKDYIGFRVVREVK